MAEAMLADALCMAKPVARPWVEEFTELVKQNQARIFRLAHGMLRDRDAAEDVAQETFVRAFRFYESFRSDSALYTWVYRIAVNLCFDAERKTHLRAVEPIEDFEDSPEVRDDAPLPDTVLELSDLVKHADDALGKMTPQHRAILLLREVEGLSYQEISRVLRVPKGTVMSRLHHARLKFQRACAELASQ